MKIYSDKALAQTLERTEARYNAAFVDSRLKMFPDRIEVDGTYAMFDGIESPPTQTFGLGLFEKLFLETIKKIEQFYRRFSAPVFHEVNPLTDPSHMDNLYQCGYHPIEMTSILYKPLVSVLLTAILHAI